MTKDIMNYPSDLNPIDIVLEEARIAVLEGKLSQEQYLDLESKLKKKEEKAIPKIAIIGMAGVGKSTTINALFSFEDYTIDIINNPKWKRVNSEKGSSFDIVELPSFDNTEIYRHIIEECSAVLYVIEYDYRLFGENIRIIKDKVVPCCDRVKDKLVIAINKVDIIGEKDGYLWETHVNMPNRKQRVEIDKTVNMFSKELEVSKDRIVCFSALTHYNLSNLLKAIIEECLFCKGNIEVFSQFHNELYSEAITMGMIDHSLLTKWKMAESILNGTNN